MIRGTAVMILNEPTVREAIQEWLDKRTTEGHRPLVSKVEWKVGGGYNTEGFHVTIAEKQ